MEEEETPPYRIIYLHSKTGETGIWAASITGGLRTLFQYPYSGFSLTKWDMYGSDSEKNYEYKNIKSLDRSREGRISYLLTEDQGEDRSSASGGPAYDFMTGKGKSYLNRNIYVDGEQLTDYPEIHWQWDYWTWYSHPSGWVTGSYYNYLIEEEETLTPSHPFWSPDAESIIYKLTYSYYENKTETYENYSYTYSEETDSSEGVYKDNILLVENLQYPQVVIKDLGWSPDSKKISYRVHGEENPENSELWVMNADGSGKTKLGDYYSPHWSRDSKRMAFLKERNIWEICNIEEVMRGEELARLIRVTDTGAGSFDWPKDSSHFVFALSDNIWVARPKFQVEIEPEHIVLTEKGEVEIKGTARAVGFSGYEVSYAQGDNWIEIDLGNLGTEEKFEETLATWDTSGLADGIYRLKLKVINEEEKSKEAIPYARIGEEAPPSASAIGLAKSQDETVELNYPLSDLVSEVTITEVFEPTEPSLIAAGDLGLELASPIYKLKPEGTTFSYPAILIFKYDPERVVEDNLDIYFYSSSENTWQALGGFVDRENNQVITGITQLSNYTLLTLDRTPPLAPQNLQGEVIAPQTVKLTWKENEELDLGGYNIYRKGTKINPTLIETNSYEDENLAANEYTYYITAQDKAGNESESSGSIEIILDTTAPVTTDDYAYSDKWTNEEAEITLNATDLGSEVAHTYYTVGGVQDEGKSIFISAEGITEVTYWSVDIAGNEELPHKTITVKIDKTAPRVEIIKVEELTGEDEEGNPIFEEVDRIEGDYEYYEFYSTNSEWEETIARITYIAEDGLSKIGKERYYLNGSEYEYMEDPNNPFRVEFNLYELAGEKIFAVEAIDLAGNSAEDSINIRVILLAHLTIKPETLKINPGVITAFVTFPQGYNVTEIIGINEELGPFCDGALPERMMLNDDETTMIIKFRRKDLELEFIDKYFEVYGFFGEEFLAEFRGFDEIKEVLKESVPPEEKGKPGKGNKK